MIKNFLLVLIMGFILGGCSPIYIPNAPMVFNNEKQGDYEINYRQGAYSSNLQGGYAVTDNINIGMSASSLYSPESGVGNTVYKGSKALEANLVAGYYNKFTSKNLLEMNVGIGSIFMTEPQGIKDYYKIYAQPTLTFLGNEGKTDTDFSMIARVVGTSFSVNEGVSDTTIFQGYFEPVLSFSVGNQLRFNTQMGVSIRFQENYFNRNSPFIFNMGIGYTLPRKREKAILP